MIVTLRARLNPLTAIGAALVLAGILGLMRGRPRATSPEPCPPADERCPAPGPAPTAGAVGARTLRADEACLDAGYLCAELTTADRMRVQRWKDFSGTVVVHVPRPDFEDAAAALELQRAAAIGIRAWNNEPFPILVDMRGDREAHVTVRWTSSLGGSQIGVAHTTWSPATGLRVLSIELATRNPFRMGQVGGAQQVRLTAAHEMGHALGLPHSGSAHDVMYPTNTASAVSAQDRRTMEVLYDLPDGIEIVR